MKTAASILAALVVACLSAAPAGAAGILLPKDNRLPPLAVKSLRVDVRIEDQVAHSHVEQVFVNSTNRQLEATYIFPLPPGASISEFAMMMNGKRVTGEVLEKGRANKIYTDIVRRMKDPGLLEYLGGNLFKARVFPVPANGEQKIEIDFASVIRPDGELAEYVFPLKTGKKASSVTDDFSLVLHLKSKVPIKTVYSPSHKIDVSRKSDHEAKVGFEESRGLLDRDFRLLYTLSDKDFGLHLITHRGKRENGYFMMMLAPKTEIKDDEVLPKDVCFVVDASGSMSGEKIRQARRALTYCLQQLRPADRFNVVRFSTDVEQFRDALVTASTDNVAQAEEYVGQLVARGGTDINGALQAALTLRSNGKRPCMVVFLTDGKPTIGEVQPQLILQQLSQNNADNTRVFVFGIGNDVNTHLLDQISDTTRATSQYVEPEEDIEVKVSSFYDKVEAPVLANLKLDLAAIGAYDVYPRQLSDLFKGRQVLVFGRYKKHGHSAVALKGRLQESEREFVYEGDFPATDLANSFIPKLWAQRKIGYLLDEIRLHGEKKELIDEVIALSKDHGIMTPYTSYLIVEDERPQTASVRSARPRADRNSPTPAEPPPPPPSAGPRPGRLGHSRVAPKAAAPGLATRPIGEAAGREMADDDGKEIAGRHADQAREEVFQEIGKTEVFKANRRLRERLRGADSGAGAVAASKQLGDMKKAQVANNAEQEEMLGVARAAGRTFTRKNGVWTDERYKPEMDVVEIKYLSDAYFQLLQRQPELKEVFALGDKAIVVLESGKAIRIGENGEDELSRKQLDALLKKL